MARAVDIPIIDAHSQVPFGYEELDKIIRLMDQGGVARTILSSKGPVTAKQLVSFASKYPGRIIPAVRTKHQLYRESDEKFDGFVKKQVNMPQFGAMAEVLMYHAQKGLKRVRAPQVIVYPDDKRVRVALKYAMKKKWPFVVHIEFRRAGSLRDKFMKKFEALLVKYPKHPFVLIHMGQLDHVDVRKLIETHDNIYFITAHSTSIQASPITVVKESEDPRTNMFDGDHLSESWKQLMIKHPNRFILGFDNVWPEHWSQYYLDQIKLWQGAIKELPREVAHVFAHGNAERLWHLPPLK
jgi:predicted TIM-barrel fold metal-dependent hydrolase